MDALLSLQDWFTLRSQGVGDFVFFKLISEYFDHKIDQFGLRLMGRMMKWISAIALTLVTLWVMIAGYRMATGQSRESMMGVVVSMTKIAVIIAVATTMSWGGTNLHRFVTVDLDKEIHALFVGSSQSSSDAIDKNLAFMQIALTAIDAVQVSDPVHPDHGLYKQALDGIEKLGPQAGFANAAERERAAAALTYEAKVSGLSKIDHVVPNASGTGLFAVQGALNDPAHQRVYADKAQAAQQPIERTTEQLSQDVPRHTNAPAVPTTQDQIKTMNV